MRDHDGISHTPLHKDLTFMPVAVSEQVLQSRANLGNMLGMLLDEEKQYGLSQYIVRDPKVCDGEPVIKGTRVTVRTVLTSLTEGAKTEEILEDFPTLKEEDIRAVIAFAAASAEEDMPVQSVPDIQ